MNCAHALVALLACAVMGAGGMLHAQARGPAVREMRSNEQQVEKPPLVLDEAARATKIAEMEAWLGRLVGRFRGNLESLDKDGRIEKRYSTALCSVIGDGPGVRCIIRMTVPGQADPGQAELTLYRWALPILYFGINPDTLEVQLVMVDAGQVGGRSGMLAGDMVDFSIDNWRVCHTAPSGHCWAVAKITVKPSGEIFMKLASDSWFQGRRTLPPFVPSDHSSVVDLHLHREPLVDADNGRKGP